MYILYKESNQSYPGTVTPRFNVRGRVIAEVSENDPINFIKGNVKTLAADVVDEGAMFVGKWKDKYYILADGQQSSSREEPGDKKVNVNLSASVSASSLSILKTVLVANVEDVFDLRFKSLNADAPDLESSTWAAQTAEASAVTADSKAATPVLKILADARGLKVADLAKKVSDNVNAYNSDVATLLGKQQSKVDEINAIDNVKDLLEWDENNFGIEMPYPLAVEKGVKFKEGVLRSTPVVTEIKF